MKKLFSLFVFSLIALNACSATTQEASEIKTFENDQFSFDYSAELELDKNGEYLYASGVGSDNWTVQIYTADFFGPRCSVLEQEKSFTDSNKRSWDYVIIKTGIPEGLEEMCADHPNDRPTERTAERTIANTKDEYVATLFYKYTTDNKEQSLEAFESILDSIDFK